MGRERIGVDGQVAGADGLLDHSPALRGLSRPEDLLHRPAGKRPDELLLLGLAAVLLDGLQHAIGHLGPVFVDNIVDGRGIADVEMGLVDDDDVFQRAFFIFQFLPQLFLEI